MQTHPYGNRPPPSLDWAPRVAAKCQHGKFVTAGPWAQDCIPDERVLEETQLRFPPFVLPMPHFVSPQDREWFVSLDVVKEFVNASLRCFERPLPPGVLCPLLDSHTSSDDVLVFWTDKYVTGRNLVLANGSFGQYHGCSWSTKYDTYLKEYPAFFGKTPHEWDKLAPMIVVQGWSFQHLIDGVLPRLMQAWEGLQDDPNITVLVDYNLPKFPVVQKIWEYLLPADRLVVFNPETIFQGKLWYQSCQSPPFHPYLWKKMRERFGYRELPFADRNVIVYLGRGKRSGQTFNHGRSVLNEDQLIEGLEAFIARRNREREAAGQAKLELVVFNHANYPTLQATIAFFNRAKVLIGPHGGSFYNLMFTPSRTLTIEFMPYQRYSTPNLIIWQQAVMLDHNYHLLPYPASGGNDVRVDVDAIVGIFEREIPS